MENTDTLLVEDGQTGIAPSEHLGSAGIPRLALEMHRRVEAWCTGRQDSLVADGPTWHDQFSNLKLEDNGPDEFVTKDRMAAYRIGYVAMATAPGSSHATPQL